MKLVDIKETLHVNELSISQAKELQQLLNNHGYNLVIDGLIGNKSKTALKHFKDKNFLGYPEFVGETTIQVLREDRENNPKTQNDFSTKQGTVNSIISECKKQGLPLKNQIAYVLATTQWETANTFQPVREAFWLSEDWRMKNLRYAPWYGRGFVQITWKANYQKYSRILGVDFVSNPDKVLEPNVSLFIMVHGFKTGSFTGMKLEDYIHTGGTDFYNARRVINGIDKAQDIADLARKWVKKI